MKRIALLFWLLLLAPAIAADNAVVVTPGVGVTMKSKDVGGGVQAMQPVLSDTSGAAIYGVAGTANANILTVQGIASMTPVLATVTFASPQAVTQSGTWNITNVSGTVSLPTGAATAAGISTVNTTLGSPFQAGGSIGNTTFAATQATAASLNATVVGTGTFATQSTLAAETTKVIGTTRTLGNAGAVVDFAGQGATSPANSWLVGAQFNTTPTTLTNGQASPLQMDNAGNLLVNIKAGAAAGGTSSNFAAAFPSAGTAVGMSQGGNMVALTGTSNNLNVQCANCSGSGVSTADEAAFTAGTSLFAGTGGFFQTTATNNALTNGQQGMWQMTANRAGFVNLRNASGTEVGTSGAEVFVGGRGTAGSAAGGVVTVQGAASMTKLLVTPDSVALPANQSVNVAQINGVTPLMGNGATGTGSQRVTIASDNTAFSVNASLTAGTGVTMQNGATANGNGTNLTVTGFGTALVNVNCSVACSGGTTINFEGTDSTGTFFSVAAFPVLGTSAAVASATTTGQFYVPVAGLTSLRARISAYSAGTITVTGTPMYGSNAHLAQVANSNANGSATSSASSPVVIASDQAAVAVKAASGAIASGAIASGAVASGAIASGAVASGAVASGAYASGSLASGAVVDITNMSVATGSAPPSKALYAGANASGATGGQVAGLVTCDKHVFKHITTATDTLAVQGVASQTIRICGWRSRAAGVATWFLENTASANANCSSTLTQITGVATEAANTGETVLAPFWTGLANTSGNGLCINSTGTGGVDVDIWYNQY